MNWNEYNLSTIISGTTNDGTKLLKLFLKDVVKKLNINQPNASCNKCLQDYYNQLTAGAKKKEMESKNYILHKKREGIALEFGSQIIVTNDNLTDEYAKILIERFKKINKDFTPSVLFEKYPTEERKEEVKEVKQKNTKTKDNDKSNVQGDI